MRKSFALALMLLLTLALCPTALADNSTGGVYQSLSDLNGKRIGIQVGTDYELIVWDLLPDAECIFYNSYPDLAAALETDKIDGFPGDEPVLKFMAAEDDRLVVLPEDMNPVRHRSRICIRSWQS